MHDINCPYCDAGQDINHDDGYGYEEDQIYEQECSECEKIFTFTTSISYYYEAEKCPCKNGEPHDWKPQQGYPEAWFHGRFKCSYCDEEEHRDEEGRKVALEKYHKELKDNHSTLKK